MKGADSLAALASRVAITSGLPVEVLEWLSKAHNEVFGGALLCFEPPFEDTLRDIENGEVEMPGTAALFFTYKVDGICSFAYHFGDAHFVRMEEWRKLLSALESDDHFEVGYGGSRFISDRGDMATLSCSSEGFKGDGELSVNIPKKRCVSAVKAAIEYMESRGCE